MSHSAALRKFEEIRNEPAKQRGDNAARLGEIEKDPAFQMFERGKRLAEERDRLRSWQPGFGYASRLAKAEDELREHNSPELAEMEEWIRDEIKKTHGALEERSEKNWLGAEVSTSNRRARDERLAALEAALREIQALTFRPQNNLSRELAQIRIAIPSLTTLKVEKVS